MANYKDRIQAGLAKEIAVREEQKEKVRTAKKTTQPLPENKRAGTGKFVGQALYTGLTSGNKGLAQTADFFLPDMLTPAAVQKGIDYYKEVGKKNEEKLAQMSDTKGRQFAGQLISGAVNMAPSAALAFLTGGASAAGGALAANGGAALTTRAAIEKAAKEAAKNPMFINSALQTLGPTYEKEREAGVSELRAGSAALANALLGAAVETSGGVETIKKGGSALKNILRTAGEEGLEEAGQYSIENLTNKALGANTARWFSTDESEDAVINPVAQAKAAASGAILGGLMGGAQTAAVKAVNKAVESKQTPQPLPVAKTAEKNAKFYMAPETQKKIFDAVEKRSGAKIQFADLPDGIDGSYENGVITVSNKAKNPAYTVLKHELTHHIEKSGDYQALSDFIEKNLRETGYDVDGALRTITEDYAKIGQNLSPEQAKKEFVAKFSEEYLFNSEKSIERLARENPNLFRRVYDWIVDTIAKLGASQETKFLIDAQRKYEKALRTVGKVTYNGPTLNGKQFLYAGVNSQLADESMKQKAIMMELEGADPETIRRETKWFRGDDSKWRFEFSDKDMEVFPNGDALFRQNHPEYVRLQDLYQKFWDDTITEAEMKELESLDDVWGNEYGRLNRRLTQDGAYLEDVIKHDELFANYPLLRRIPYRLRDLEFATNGQYRSSDGSIEISNSVQNREYLREKLKDTLVHEIQHAIQDYEDFASGASPEFYEGVDFRENDYKLAAAEERYQNLYKAAPLELKEKIVQIGIAKLRSDYDAMQKLEDEIFESKYADLYSEILDADFERKGDRGEKLSAYELYRNTAGEKEARDAASRRLYDESQRAAKKPDVGGFFVRAENFVGNTPAFSAQKNSDSDGNQLSPEQQEYFADSKIRDEDGNLRVVYHGTEEKFTVFDRTKGRANMDIQGMFFSPWEDDAGGYGGTVKAYYLNIKNPAPESLGYKALRMFQGQNGAGIKAREYLEKLGYDGVNNGDEEYIAFYPEQIKLVSNTKPTANEDIRYSAGSGLQTNDALKKASQGMYTDTEGHELSAGQKRFFQNSKVRDSEGNLKVMYHGTGSAGFTVFNPSYSGDGQGLFFTDSPEVARGYSATEKEFTPHDFKTPEQLQEYILDEMGEEVEIKKNGDWYELWQDDEFVVRDRDLHALYWDFNDEIVGYGGDSGNYKVYLNLENPLEIDAQNDNWDEITVDWSDEKTTTNNIAWYAMENGYDGVIINNVVDMGIYSPTRDMKPSTVAVAFNPNQIKAVSNAEPTKDDDIRYSAGRGLKENQALKKASMEAYSDEDWLDDEILLQELEDDDILTEITDGFTWNTIKELMDGLKNNIEAMEAAEKPKARYKEKTKGKGLQARLTDERINSLFEKYGASTPTYAKAYITSIHPRDFLSLTLPDELFEQWDAAELEGSKEFYPLDIEKLRSQEQTPFLEIDETTGRVEGHEGRHRMRALLAAGVTEVPIAVIDNRTKNTKDYKKYQTLYAQQYDLDDGPVNDNALAVVTDLVPINKANEETIKMLYGGEGDVQYSGGENLKRDAALYKASQTLYKEKGNRYINNMETPEAGERPASFISETPVRGEKKATSYQRRARRNAKEAVKNILGVSKFADSRKIDAALDEAIEKMKTHSFTNADRDALFDEMFSEGIVVNQKMVSQYANLKQTLRNTQLHVTKDVANNIADFNDFRKRNLNTIRLSNEGGSEIDTFYDEVQRDYPELFPDLNTPAEMLERLSAVGKSIKETETRLQEMYDEDFDAFYQASRESFDREMDKLQDESTRVSRYLRDRNKKISVADAKARIEEIGRLRREADKIKAKEVLTDIDKSYVEMLHEGKLDEKGVRYLTPLSADAIMRVYAAEAPLKQAQAALKELGAQTRAEYRQLANQMLSGSELWKDKSAGWKYGRETAERNMRDIAGKSGERLAKEFFEPIHTSEAVSTKMKSDLRKTVKALDISTKDKYDITDLMLDAPGLTEQINEARSKKKRVKVSESTLVQLYGEGLISIEDLEHVKADVKKIQSATSELRNVYNQLIDAANRELIRHGYEPIEYRQNYFPHFSEDKPDGLLANIANKLGFNIVKDELPTDIAGLTHTFKPGKKWFGNALQRTSRVTEYDAIKGFDIYLEGVADVIHHTEDIQKLRQLETELRYRYSTEGVKAEIDRINNDQDISEVQKQAMLDQVYEKSNTHLGNLAVWLRGYTDSLAGKKAQIDRTFEHNIGRGLYNTSKALENRVAANMVAINPGSWLTNFIPLVQGSEAKNSNIIKGMAQTISNHMKPDGVAESSTFITNRKGSDVLWKSTAEQWQDALTKPMEIIDSFVSESLVRARYLEELDKGKNPYDAMRIADDFAAGVIADRSKGALPTMFNAKNPISKILTMYQVEVNNQWSHLFKDIPRTEKNVMKVAWAYAKFAIGAYIFNDVYEALIGRRPALDPLSWINDFVGDLTGKQLPNFVAALIEAAKGEGLDLEEKDEKGAAGAVTSLGENVAENIPFVGGLLGGGRVPIQSALPEFSTLATSTADLLSGENQKKAVSDIGKELLKPATYIVPPVGGGQLKKVGETAVNYARGGNYAINKDGERELRFAVDREFLPTAQSALFGQYSGKNAVKYVEGGFKRLSAKETKAYESLINSGVKPTEAEDFLRGLPSKKSEVKTAILNSGYTAAQKNAIGKALYPDDNMDFSDKAELKYSTLPEASKEKVKGLKDAGLSTASALKAYEVQKKYSADVEKAYALMQQDYYKDSVLKALEISENSAEKAKALDNAGVSMDTYQAAKTFADSDMSGNVSKEEAIAYFKKRDFSKEEKYALLKALTSVKDKNNPYR